VLIRVTPFCGIAACSHPELALDGSEGSATSLSIEALASAELFTPVTVSHGAGDQRLEISRAEERPIVDLDHR
jgi:hypothetical protein